MPLLLVGFEAAFESEGGRALVTFEFGAGVVHALDVSFEVCTVGEGSSANVTFVITTSRVEFLVNLQVT